MPPVSSGIYFGIFLIPFLFRNNFDLKPKKNKEDFKIQDAAWASMILWTSCYIVAALLGLWHVWRETPGFSAGIGWGILFAGIWIRRLSFAEIEKFYHPMIGIKPGHQIIDQGVYRYLRHPLHLGLFMEISGWCLMSESVWSASIFAIALVNTLYRNTKEEAHLVSALGEPYAAYVARTWDITKPFN